MVHTAIPDKYKANPELPKHEYTIFTPDSSKRKRTSSSYLMNDSTIDTTMTRITPPTVLNRRPSSRTISSSQEGEGDSHTDDQSEETYKIETKNATDLIKDDFYEEIHIQPQPMKRVQYIVVKPKKTADESSATFEISSPTKKPRICKEELEPEDPEQIFFETEEQTETVEETVLESEQSASADAMVGYSEFIFNGEKYVQMPKRLFEAEKEKNSKEVERYRNILRKMKAQLNCMDLD